MTDDDIAPVIRTNEEFYRALQDRDLALMGSVWAPVPEATCVHPGWRRLRGWTDIRRSWAAIFQNTESWRVTCTDIQAGCRGDTAWVTCVELIQPSVPGETASVMAATNVYVRLEGRFRMLHHHASPMPMEAPAGPVN